MNTECCLVYEDDGPNGICAQSMSITMPWLQVHIFASEEDAGMFREMALANTGRKNPRVRFASHVSDHRFKEPNQ